MFPQMTERQNVVMVELQSKKVDELDPFEKQMRGQAGRLSMQIDQLGSLVNNLRDKLEKAEKEQTTLVGEFQGVVMAVEAYANTRQTIPDGGEGKDKEPDGKEPEDKKPDNVVPMKPEGGKEPDSIEGKSKKAKRLARKQKKTAPEQKPEI